jgi:hypothetical protein
MQINLTGFLTDSTPAFMVALWDLLIEAQASPAGIPRSFVEEKKEEMRRAKEGDTRALAERDRRMRLDEVRERERSERSERGGARGRGGRGRRGRGGIGGDDRSENRTRDNGWSNRGGGVCTASNLVAKVVLIFSFRHSVRDIAHLHDPVRPRHVAERLPAIAPLAQVALPVARRLGRGLALGLALPFGHVLAVHLRAVGYQLRQEAHLLHQYADAAARHRTLHVTKSETAELEGATVAVPRHVGDALVFQHAVVPPVGARIHPVVGAAPALVAVEGIAHRRATGPRRAADGEGGTDASVEAAAGVQRMGGARKGCLVGAEAGLEAGAQVCTGDMGKVRAKDEIRPPQVALCQESRSRDRHRSRGRDTRSRLVRCDGRSSAYHIQRAHFHVHSSMLGSRGTAKTFRGEKASSKRRRCATKSFVRGRGRQVTLPPSPLGRGALLENN